MPTSKDEKREGFWRSQEEPDLPMPMARSKPMGDKGEFLCNLQLKQDGARESAYRGFSVCRICRKPNGNEEYAGGGWRWPQGYRHYIEEHNVQPSPEFFDFIMKG